MRWCNSSWRQTCYASAKLAAKWRIMNQNYFIYLQTLAYYTVPYYMSSPTRTAGGVVLSRAYILARTVQSMSLGALPNFAFSVPKGMHMLEPNSRMHWCA